MFYFAMKWLGARLHSPRVALAGLAVMLIGVAPEALGIGDPGVGLLQWLVIVVGLLALVVGWLGSRLVGAYKGLALVALNTAVLFGLLEICARFYLGMESGTRPAEDPVALSRYIAAQPWGARLEGDVKASRGLTRYEPYILWRRLPFRSETVNIDTRGDRVTPGARCTPESKTVLVLGGSTTWGVGSPDWTTIPAFLQKGLAETPPGGGSSDAVCVRNLGEVGFVVTQEVLKLMNELRAGRIPDVVVFYDGVNEVITGLSTGCPGYHYGYEGVRTKMEVSALQQLVAQSGLARMLGLTKPPPQVSHPSLDTLAEAIVDNYLANVRLVSALAREYGFRFLFFWQPVLVAGGHQPVQQETSALRQASGSLERLYRDVYTRIAPRIEGEPHVRNVADVFDSVHSEVYVDFAHLLPNGNAAVAKRMLVDLLPLVSQPRSPNGVHDLVAGRVAQRAMGASGASRAPIPAKSPCT